MVVFYSGNFKLAHVKVLIWETIYGWEDFCWSM